MLLEGELLRALHHDEREALRLAVELGLVARRSESAVTTGAAREAEYAASGWPELRGELVQRLAARRWTGEEAAGQLVRGAGRLPEDLLAALARPRRLVLARHLLAAADVVREVRRRLSISRGLDHPPEGADRGEDLALEAADRALAALPAYERAIAEGLLEDDSIYWASPATLATEGAPELVDPIDGLVVRPPGTVVLVVRPPASDWELELKRAGTMRRAGSRLRPLSIAAAPAPSHRLVGGSTVAALTWEAVSVARLGAVYRRVHGSEPPMSTVLAIRTVYTVPTADGEAYLLDYFTEPDLFGDGYEPMRAAVEANLATFAREGRELDVVPGAIGETTAFLGAMAPAQAAISGTSALRLDRVADALEPAAAAADPATAERLLEEILGEVARPAGAGPEGPHDPVGEALGRGENRARADRLYLALAERIGTFWGTLLGVWGTSHGESLTGRNVGLRARWHRGRRQVEIVFMDHDNVCLPTPSRPPPRPRALLAGVVKDALGVFGGAYRGRDHQGSLELLERIYRVGLVERELGRSRLEAAVAAAYRATRAALAADAGLAELLHPELVVRADRWEECLRRRRAAASARADDSGSEEAAALERYGAFLDRRPYLFAGG